MNRGTLTSHPQAAASVEPWDLTRPVVSRDGGRTRVSVMIDGSELWFESDALAPAPRPEGFATAMLLPAMKLGRRMRIDAAVDRRWRANLDELCAIHAGWWSWPAGCPVDATATLEPSPPARASGQCFTGGVDSFYTLLQGPHRTDRLVFVAGYDVPLEDEARLALVERSLAAVAEATGRRPLMAATNLRSVPAFRRVGWESSHGTALAAVGHLLADHLGTLVIPSSYRRDRLRPWGSHPQTDPLCGGDRLRIIHDGDHAGRLDKITAIADHPLVHQHLRVCWENRTSDGNCGRCEKCVLTMTALDGLGRLGAFVVFDRARPVEELLDGLPGPKPGLDAPWRDIAAMRHRPAVARALRRLFARGRGSYSARAANLIHRAAGRARQWLGG